MKFVNNFTPPDFQAKDFAPLISLNFNSFSDKNTKQCFVLLRNLHHWQKFYTAGGNDGSDKSHLWIIIIKIYFDHYNFTHAGPHNNFELNDRCKNYQSFIFTSQHHSKDRRCDSQTHFISIILIPKCPFLYSLYL